VSFDLRRTLVGLAMAGSLVITPPAIGYAVGTIDGGHRTSLNGVMADNDNQDTDKNDNQDTGGGDNSQNDNVVPFVADNDNVDNNATTTITVNTGSGTAPGAGTVPPPIPPPPLPPPPLPPLPPPPGR